METFDLADLLTLSYSKLTDEFEFISVRGAPLSTNIHNPTPHDPFMFAFDNGKHSPCPLLHFQASHIALIVQAEPHLSSITRVKSLKSDAAESQIASLLRLYQCQPNQYSDLTFIIPAPVAPAQSDDADGDLYVDTQLMEYAKERSVTWEELKNRPPLFGGVDVGPWRFASANDRCRRRWF